MRARALPTVGLFLLLVLALPPAVRSNSEVVITGIVVGIDPAQESFLLQDLGAASGRFWTVRVTAATEARRLPDGFARGAAPALRLLRAGDVVEIQGWVTGGNQLLARALTVRSGPAGTDGRFPGAGREIRLVGTIVGLEGRGQGIVHLRAQSFVQAPNTWTIRLHPRTEVTGLLNDRPPEVRRGRGPRGALHLLRVGDIVEVEGRLVGDRQVLAEEITVRAPIGLAPVPSPTPIPFPGPIPFSAQTVILAPHQGAEIAPGAFAVVGQTFPGAQVRVEVTARLGILQLPVTSGTVVANQAGFFVFEVRPPLRVPGTVYTITVTSTSQGFTAPPVSVTVRQL